MNEATLTEATEMLLDQFAELTYAEREIALAMMRVHHKHNPAGVAAVPANKIIGRPRGSRNRKRVENPVNGAAIAPA